MADKPKSKNKSAGRPSYLDPTDSIGYLSRINFRAFSTALQKLTAKHGVTAGQWRFLRVLWVEDNITQRELSDRVGIKEATTVRAIDSLVKAGLVVRRRSSDDRRKVSIRLTRKAKNLEAKLLPLVVQVNEHALQGIDPADVETTRRVLKITFENLVQKKQET